MRYVLMVNLLSALTCLSAGAAAPDDAAIAKEFAEAFGAMRAGDLRTFVGHMHPDAHREFRDIFTPILEAAKSTPENPAKRREFLRLFGGEKTLEQIAAMPPDEFLANFLDGVFSSVPRLKQSMAGIEFEVIGVVYEKDDGAHLVYRGKVTVEAITVSKIAVASYKKSGEGWKLLLTGDIKGMGEQIRRSLPS